MHSSLYRLKVDRFKIANMMSALFRAAVHAKPPRAMSGADLPSAICARLGDMAGALIIAIRRRAAKAA